MKTTLWTPPKPRGHAAGFTLIELMITVAIVAILTAVAYPSYRNYVLRGQIVNATTGLAAVSANMERYFQDNRTYVGGPCSTAATYGNFTVSCPTAPVNTPNPMFTVSAVGNTGSSVSGFTYTIDQAGNKATSVAPPAPSAWIPAGGTCPTSWETSAGQC